MVVASVYYFSKRTGDAGAFDITANQKVAAVFCTLFILSLISDGMFLDGMNRLAQGIRERERLQALEMESELKYDYIKNMESSIVEMR